MLRCGRRFTNALLRTPLFANTSHGCRRRFANLHGPDTPGRLARVSAERWEGLIFASACAGMSKTDVAEELQCSVRTVDTHWNRIFGKMGVRSAQGVLAAALREVLCPQARIAFGAIRFSAMSPSYFPASQVAR